MSGSKSDLEHEVQTSLVLKRLGLEGFAIHHKGRSVKKGAIAFRRTEQHPGLVYTCSAAGSAPEGGGKVTAKRAEGVK